MKNLIFKLAILLILICTTESNSQGLWTAKTTYPGGVDAGGASFIISTKIYYIDAGGTSDASELWEYNITTDTWTQKADFAGSGRSGIAAFAIGTKGYAGTGSNSAVQSDFYEYDPTGNTWTAKTSFPGTARTTAIGFAIGTKGYIGIGRDCCSPLSDLYEYDPTGNTWTAKASFPGSARFSAACFVINSKAYVGTGRDYVTNYYSDFYEYDPTGNSWTSKTSFPGTARSNAIFFAIGTNGYIGSGTNGTLQTDFYQYDQTNNTWTQKNNITFSARESVVGVASTTKGYIVGGYDGSTSTNDLYEYDPNDLATLTTTAVSSITGTTASSGGNVSSDGGSAVTARGVVWSTATGPTVALGTKTTNGSGTGSFTSSITGLALNTTYYVRAYATNAIGTSYGGEATFTTLNIPTLTTDAISAITGTTATGGGNVTANGGAAVTAKGIVWNTATNPTIVLATKTNDGSGNGAFTSSMTGLSFNTTYYIRAYATNSVGTAYGNEVSFTTNASAVLKIYEAISNDSTKAFYVAEVITDGGTPLTQRGIVLDTTVNPTINSINKIIDVGTGIGSYSATFTGLTNAKKYYARSYAINADGISYSPSDIIYTHDEDGVTYEEEKNAPNSGDGNGDGIPDYAQNNVVSLNNGIDNHYLTIALQDNTKDIINVVNMKTTDNAHTHNYPYGINSFKVNASSATITVIYHDVSSTRGAVYRKQLSNGKWFNYESATLTNLTIGGKAAISAKFVVTDGGLGDADGIVNGVIDDPGGLAFLIPDPANIPTLSEWARIVLISFVCIIGIWFMKKSLA